VALTGVVAVASSVGAVLLLRRGAQDWTGLGLAAFALLAAAGFLDATVSRLEMDGDSLHVVSLFRRRRYVRSAIVKVQWEGGSGVGLRLSDGSWVELPDLGRNIQGLAHTLRAWLKSHDDGAQGAA